MDIFLGIIIGIVLGGMFAVGLTLHGLSSSNMVGEEHTNYNDFLYENSPVTYHVSTDTYKHHHNR